MHRSGTNYSRKQSKRFSTNMPVDFEGRSTGIEFFFFINGQNVKLKHLNDGFVSYKHTALNFTRH